MTDLSLTVPKRTQKGQTLIEAIVAIGVAVLVMSGLVVAVISAVKNAQFAKNQSLATKYALEGMELVRQDRDTNWAIFYGRISPNSYCLNTQPWSSGQCASFNLGGIFKREAMFEQEGADPNKVKVTMTVSWRDPTGDHKSELVSYFTKWQ
jgi:type II secretory pathway pseudopilin PulG